ncbi:MAG TPA: protein kinase [Pyrinomonadaceae bacterium]|nr:protein kinase [Pyrinomonadaceae bacterium]
MTPQQYERLTELFHAALEIAPTERQIFLDHVSESDAELRSELEALLVAEASALTRKPPNDIAAGYLARMGDCSATRPLLTPHTRLDHYEICSLLGKGGMGEVYLAEDILLHRKVALKILPVEVAANQDRMRRFEQEAQAAAALNHPNIAHIYEMGKSENTNFIAIEHIDGDTLRDKIHREKAPLPELLQYLTQVAEGLSKAHAAGIVHRDLKPDNIMITRDDYAKILDFGLAKLVDPQRPEDSSGTAPGEAETAVMAKHSLAGTVMGTAGYMSPEQAEGKVNEIDHRSDIFSFGCILFEAVTGRKPFVDESVVKSLHKVVPAAPLIKDLNPSVPSDLQRIVSRCLATDREERYQTIKEVALELKELLHEFEVIAGAGTAGVPSRNNETRNQSSASTSGQMRAAATESASVASRAGSAAYVLTRISHNAVLALMALLVLTAAVAYFAYTRYAHGDDSGSIRSIAVLPLVNATGDPDSEYLSDGITDGLISKLSQLPNLKVMSRNSVFHYKGKATNARAVGPELDVQAVLTGRLVRSGDGLAISVELVNASDNSHIWGAQYDRDLSDLMALPGDISQAVTDGLRLKLSGEEKQRLAKSQTNNFEAYQAYLKGMYHTASFAPGGFEKAIEYFDRAIAIEPNYVQAYAGLANAYAELPFTDVPPQPAMLKARSAAKRALELDDTLAEAHRSLSIINLNYDWDWPAAERECWRAIELNPGDALNHQYCGWFLGLMGRFDESLVALHRAEILDPLSPNINFAIGINYYWSGQYDRAIEECRKATELNPNVGGLIRLCLGEAYLKQRKYPEAIAEIQKAGQFGVMQAATLGYAYAASGNRTKAEKVLGQLQMLGTQQYVPPFTSALIYAGLGDKDQAFAWLEKAYTERSVWMPSLKVDPKFDSLRSDPHFAELVRRVGLPQ